MLEKVLSVFIMVLLAIGCDHAKKRTVGRCYSSGAYGGPYKVVKGGYNLIVEDEAGQTKRVPNDITWSEVNCSF